MSCAPQPQKRGLFDCFKSKKPACGSTCAPVRKPGCTTSACATQPKKGLFDCFKSKKSACGQAGCATSCGSCSVGTMPVAKPHHTVTPSQPAIQYHPAPKHIPAPQVQPAPHVQPMPTPAVQPMPAVKPMPAPAVKPMPTPAAPKSGTTYNTLPPAPSQNSNNAYYPSRVNNQQTTRQNRLEDLFGAPN